MINAGSVRAHLRSNVVGYVAIALTLTMGTAWAVSLPNRSVKTRHLAPGAVKTGKIAQGHVRRGDIGRNAVNSGKVAPNSIFGRDIAEQTLGTVPNADQLDGFDANSLVRLAAGSSTDTASLSPDELRDLITLEVEAPADGYLFIHGTVLNPADEEFWLDGSQHGPTPATGFAVVPVVSGEHTLVYKARNPSSGSGSVLSPAEMAVLFVPFDGSGN